MRFTKLAIPDVIRIEIDKIEDDRGFFGRMFCQQELAEQGIEFKIAQCNNTLTEHAGTLRGLHFQRPRESESRSAEAKIVRCFQGGVMDVAVDLRANSATFGRACSLELTAANRSMVYIPPGFAHGFQTLMPKTELFYFHSDFYSKPGEGGLHPLDSSVGIDWPLPVAQLSTRDQALPELSQLRPIEL